MDQNLYKSENMWPVLSILGVAVARVFSCPRI